MNEMNATREKFSAGKIETLVRNEGEKEIKCSDVVSSLASN